MNIQVLASDILSAVGGEQNIAEVVHCATRLRFTLHDNSRVDVGRLQKLDGVITTVQSGGQFQVVIGNKVADVFKAIDNILGHDTNRSQKVAKSKKHESLLGRLVDIISSIFTPLLGAMAASGIIKGLLSIAFANEWLDKKESTAIILQSASDSLFYFLPILLAITAARKFKTDIFVAVTLAGAMVYPDIIAFFTNHVEVTFFGIPVMMLKYTGTVLPIILAVYVMSLLERMIKNYIHETVRSVLLPFILLLIMFPLTLITIGPIGVFASEAVASIFVKIFSLNPIIASALFAGGYQIFVIFGLHWAFTPIIINDITTLGRSTLKASTVPSVFAQSGAVLAVLFKTKNKKMKTLASGAFISSVFGITEPAVYGITLKLKKPFICAVLASTVGGGIVGYFNSAAISVGIPSLVTLPIFYGEGFYGLLIGIVTSFVLAAILTYIVGFDDPLDEEIIASQSSVVATSNIDSTTSEANSVEEIYAPVGGRLVPLDAVEDNVFSSGIIGKGIAIEPIATKIVSPINGKVISVQTNGHAIHLLSDNGAEILIHIGIDTIQLGGKYFNVHVADGDIIKQGDLLVECAFDKIKQAGFNTIIPVIITNSERYSSVTIFDNETIDSGQPLFILLNNQIDTIKHNI